VKNSAAVLLDDLRARGAKLAVDGDLLRWRAPKGALSSANVEAISANKGELIDLLTRTLKPEIALALVRIESESCANWLSQALDGEYDLASWADQELVEGWITALENGRAHGRIGATRRPIVSINSADKETAG